MDSVANRVALANTDKVRSIDLPEIIKTYKNRIKVLSLDCFDTLIWRKTASPADVFAILQSKPTFNSLGFTAELRVRAESNARASRLFKYGDREVKLNEIYLSSFPDLTQTQLNSLVEEEISAELDACYAFSPMLDLIRAAHAEGLKIIIVSDIYLTEKQLRRILANAIPQDVLAMIDRIFCSCDHGRSKVENLFQTVIQSIGFSAEHILHIGDNQHADLLAPRTLKVNTLHFIQQGDDVNNILRLQELSAKLLDPRITSSHPMYSPFRPILSQNQLGSEQPEVSLGYVSLGPIMYAFTRFICNEIKQLHHAGKRTKVLFIMRDGYLPSLATEEFEGKAIGHRIQISRFAAFAASLCTQEDILNYFIEIGRTNRYGDLARQLLLPEHVSEPIIKSALKSHNPTFEFIRLILQPKVTDLILTRSAEYRTRLIRHVKKIANIEAGDTIVLVDLGYSGTAQRRLTPVFKELGIETIGRYLISLSVPGWQENRKGLFDPSCFDERAMQSLVIYISILEQLCTVNEGSVVDYAENGDPVYSNVQISQKQIDKLTQVQAQCLRFIREAKTFFHDNKIVISDEIFQQSAFANLSRLIYLGTESELNYLKTFEMEMNLGTNDILRIFDPEKGLADLRKRGMFYMEHPAKSKRTNYPAELRSIGIEFSLSLMVQHRYSLFLKLNDLLVKRESVSIVFVRGHEVHQTTVEAISTHEGYFALWLPAGVGNTQISVLLGQKYQLVQIESAELVVLDAFVQQNEANNTIDVKHCLSYEYMQSKGGELFECLFENSTVTMKPTMQLPSMQYIYRLVFRPIVKRSSHVQQSV